MHSASVQYKSYRLFCVFTHIALRSCIYATIINTNLRTNIVKSNPVSAPRAGSWLNRAARGVLTGRLKFTPMVHGYIPN